MAHTSGASPGYLVHLVSLVYPIGLVQPNKQDRLADFFSILPLECPFSLEIPAKAAHQVGTERPTFRFLHVWIGKMPTNFLKAFFCLLIPLQPLGLLQRRIERLKRQLVVPKRANPFDGFHHGLIPEGRQML